MSVRISSSIVTANSATTIDLLMSFFKLEMEMEVEMDFFDTIKLDHFFL